MIYTLRHFAYDDWHRQAWAAGLVLLVLVLIANIAAAGFSPVESRHKGDNLLMGAMHEIRENE